MNELMVKIAEMVANEYSRAAGIYGLYNNSDHESFAVILEEFQEASENMTYSGQAIDIFWGHVKKDADSSLKLEALGLLYQNAMLAACELVQVAAMAKKAEVTLKQKEGIYDQ